VAGDSLSFLLILAIGGFVVGIALIAVLFGRNRGQASVAASEPERITFSPKRLSLKGTHGEVLRAKVRVEGPPTIAFTTFVEEPWWLATPSSGLPPHEMEIILYTDRAPFAKRHSLTLRLFPADVTMPIDEMKIEVRLRPSGKKGHVEFGGR
jgi:hypothetical protein